MSGFYLPRASPIPLAVSTSIFLNHFCNGFKDLAGNWQRRPSAIAWTSPRDPSLTVGAAAAKHQCWAGPRIRKATSGGIFLALLPRTTCICRDHLRQSALYNSTFTNFLGRRQKRLEFLRTCLPGVLCELVFSSQCAPILLLECGVPRRTSGFYFLFVPQCSA